MKKLFIIESPHKAVSLTKYLSNPTTKSKYTKNLQDEVEVVATTGHIFKLNDKDKGFFRTISHNHAQYCPSWVLDDGSDGAKNNRQKVIQNLIQKIQDPLVDGIYIMTDDDQEGELIGWEVKQLIDKYHPNVLFQRVSTSEITQRGVDEGLSHPRGLNQAVIDAAISRWIIDRDVGFSVSQMVKKLLWTAKNTPVSELKKTYGLNDEEVETIKNLDYNTIKAQSDGRVKHYALHQTVKLKEHQDNFKAHNTYQLTPNLNGVIFKNSASFNHVDGKFAIKNITDDSRNNLVYASKQHALDAKALLNKEYEITSVKDPVIIKAPAKPFITANDINVSKMNIPLGSNDFSQALQFLYAPSSGLVNVAAPSFISYPRTDNNKISPEFLADKQTDIQTFLKQTNDKLHQYRIKHNQPWDGDEVFYHPVDPQFLNPAKNSMHDLSAQNAHECLRITEFIPHEPDLRKNVVLDSNGYVQTHLENGVLVPTVKSNEPFDSESQRLNYYLNQSLHPITNWNSVRFDKEHQIFISDDDQNNNYYPKTFHQIIKKVYKEIRNHTLQALTNPPQYVILQATAKNNQDTFSAIHKSLQKEGYLVFDDDAKQEAVAKNDFNAQIKNLQVGMKCVASNDQNECSKEEVWDAKTNLSHSGYDSMLVRIHDNPDLDFDEQSLAIALQQKGVGRPSTQHSTIQALADPKRQLFQTSINKKTQQPTSFQATALACALIKMTQKVFPVLNEDDLTAQMNQQLEDIALNKTDKDQVIENFYQLQEDPAFKQFHHYNAYTTKEENNNPKRKEFKQHPNFTPFKR